jgi:hypothetical protein
MIQQNLRKASHSAGIALMFSILFSAATIGGLSAQSHVYAQHFTKPEKTLPFKPHSLQVAVYQVENTSKFKVHFENLADTPVMLRIKNSSNKVIHSEVVKDKKYVRKFNLDNMADGSYTFEITNKDESYTKEIQLETLSARTIQIME